MGSQQLNLKWRNHHSNLLTVFDKLLVSEMLSDVTLACEGMTLKAHKMILSACSPFFHNLFSEHPNNHPIVILKDVHYRDLKAVVDFMYRGEVNICQDQLPTVLQTAELLRVKGLAESTDGRQQNRPRQTSETPKRRKRTRMPSGLSSENGNIPPQFPRIAQAIALPKFPSPPIPVQNPRHSDGSNHSTSNWAASTETAELVEVNMNTESDIEKDAQASTPTDSIRSNDLTDSKAGCTGGTSLASNLEPVIKLEEVDDDEDDDDDDLPEYPQTPNFHDPFQHPSPGDFQRRPRCKPLEDPPLDAPHELARLPRHKKKDCAVCGNRKAGLRRRSRQWCPGCNVGVHVHCFDQLTHFRRASKRRADPSSNLPCVLSKPTLSVPCSPSKPLPSLPCSASTSPSSLQCSVSKPASSVSEPFSTEPASSVSEPTSGLPCIAWKPEDGSSYLVPTSGFPAIFGFISPSVTFPKVRASPSRRPCSQARAIHFPISEEIVARCARVDPQKFVNDLLSELYTEEYLASHSVTGQKCPYKDSTQKPGFNPVELAHIIRTVQGAFSHRSLSDTEIKAYIRVKLGNASKLYARRKQNM